MLSFNIDDKILKRIERRLYSKQDQITGGGDCANINQEQMDDFKENTDVHYVKSSKSVASYIRRHIIRNSQARNTNYQPHLAKKTLENYGKHDVEAPYANSNNHSNNVEQVNKHLGFKIGFPIAGSVFHWAKSGLNMFNTHQKDSLLDTVSNSFSTVIRNGKRVVMDGVNATLQTYRKRLRGNGKFDDDGNLKPKEGFVKGSVAYRNQEMAEDWEGVIWERDGEGKVKLRENLTEKHWQKYLDEREKRGLALYDQYDKGGNVLLKQVPKQVIASLHNIDVAEIRSSINTLRELHESGQINMGDLWSDNKKVRENIISKIRNVGTDDEGNPIQPSATHRVFIEMLENREFPRTLNNTMQVVMHGKENMYKYFRVMYQGMADEKMTKDIHGAEIDLKNTSMGRGALVREMSKMLLARKLFKERNDREPNMAELSEALSVGVYNPDTQSYDRPNASSPSKISKVDSVVFNAFQKGLYDVASAGGNTTPTKGLIMASFLKEHFNLTDKKGVANPDFSSRDKINKNPGEMEKKIKAHILKANPTILESGLTDEELDLQVSAIRASIADFRVNSMSNTTDADTAKTRSDNMKQFLKDLSSPVDEDSSRDKNFKEYKKISAKLHKAFLADGQPSPEETELEGASRGLFNKTLDIFTALQVHKLERGQTGSKGGSAFLFEDHHIYGKGDNQANTHFAMVFKPFHQNGLHATNYLIESYDTALENLSMLKQYISNYKQTGGFGSAFEIPQEMIDRIKNETPETLKKKFISVGKKGKMKLKPGEYIESMTMYPTVKGNVSNRESLGMEEIHSVFAYPPVTDTILNQYKNTINIGNQKLSLWGATTPGDHAGTILGQTRNIDGEIAVSALDPEWYLEENELAIGE